MCRHLAWTGEPRTLAELLLEPEHGLLRQSWAPRRQSHGTVNADGWGVGWYTPARPEPARWRAARPLWAEASLTSVAPHVSSGCVLAAVRSATAGMPGEESACAPFARGRHLLSHNGVVDRSTLPAGAWPLAESVCDSAVLAAHLLAAPDELGERVAAAGAADPGARLNVLLTDGERVLATAWGDTLSVLRTPEGVALASEPFDDDPRWCDVPDRTLVTATPDGVALTPLETT
ncbi:ergothioneine biosynthesis protein EgtC [Kineococcus indalonis]|uniref:ergothioneine biosynthesis protein EgtC n=1 Tax=Kineococcus indalonis TaxID=2696566 RepID=UPI0014134C6F|nr:ergothioneine biosynthesis protein EgtC [Kineococcus indalonis]NAZ88457.1 ergothioneine biosynthesis protein EgtC [Kineococcus indalonis]